MMLTYSLNSVIKSTQRWKDKLCHWHSLSSTWIIHNVFKQPTLGTDPCSPFSGVEDKAPERCWLTCYSEQQAGTIPKGRNGSVPAWSSASSPMSRQPHLLCKHSMEAFWLILLGSGSLGRDWWEYNAAQQSMELQIMTCGYKPPAS